MLRNLSRIFQRGRDALNKCPRCVRKGAGPPVSCLAGSARRSTVFQSFHPPANAIHDIEPVFGESSPPSTHCGSIRGAGGVSRRPAAVPGGGPGFERPVVFRHPVRDRGGPPGRRDQQVADQRQRSGRRLDRRGGRSDRRRSARSRPFCWPC